MCIHSLFKDTSISELWIFSLLSLYKYEIELKNSPVIWLVNLSFSNPPFINKS